MYNLDEEGFKGWKLVFVVEFEGMKLSKEDMKVEFSKEFVYKWGRF